MMNSEIFHSQEISIYSDLMMQPKDFRVNLTEYLSMEHRYGADMYYLNLDRSIKQSDLVEPLLDNESVQGISLAHNYLLQMPNFVADYTNLIEIDASFNELYEIEFLLYQSLNENHSTNEQRRPKVIHPCIDLSCVTRFFV